jgi:hypothetical protein
MTSQHRYRATAWRLGAVIVHHHSPRRPAGPFGRCASCGGLSIRGICQVCGFAVVCSCCGKLRQPGGEWAAVPRAPGPESHGICPACIRAEYGDAMADRLDAARAARGE